MKQNNFLVASPLAGRSEGGNKKSFNLDLLDDDKVTY
jgi:hypothetical protein